MPISIAEMSAAFLESHAEHREHYRPEAHITICLERPGQPLRFKRVGKPRLRLRQKKWMIWECRDFEALGLGPTPAAAYAAWKRNHFIGSPTPSAP